MPEDAQLSAAQLRRVHDAGVDQLVHDEDVTLAQQRDDGSLCR